MFRLLSLKQLTGDCGWRHRTDITLVFENRDDWKHYVVCSHSSYSDYIIIKMLVCSANCLGSNSWQETVNDVTVTSIDLSQLHLLDCISSSTIQILLIFYRYILQNISTHLKCYVGMSRQLYKSNINYLTYFAILCWHGWTHYCNIMNLNKPGET